MTIKKQKKAAKELLQAAHKVYCYRKDLIPESGLEALDTAVGELEDLIRDQATEATALVASMDRLDALLREFGGKIYPKTVWSDNLEVALVAAIIVIGIRTFFFQPFIIPTNSMYPTYSGMNAVMYEDKESAPAAPMRLFRLATLGAKHKSLVAEKSGQVQIPVQPTQGGSVRPYFEEVKARKWLIIPTVLAEYTVLIGGQPHKIRVPRDFDMLGALLDSFPETESEVARTSTGTGYVLNLGHRAQEGETVLRFDITLGDALFVDRISYHFTRPEAGDPFVFRTRDIPGIEGGPNTIVDKYYIKRIGGVGGETLEIEDGTLLVDGQPRDEVSAFGRNARREGEYGGYLNKDLLAEGRELPIPEGKFVALGDNSGNSLDSRYWGFVPEKAVIGKAIFIYYPFTKRWGLAE